MQLVDLLEYLSLKDVRFVHRVISESIIAQPCFSLPAKEWPVPGSQEPGAG